MPAWATSVAAVRGPSLPLDSSPSFGNGIPHQSRRDRPFVVAPGNSNSLRSPPHPAFGHLLPARGEKDNPETAFAPLTGQEGAAAATATV